MAIRNPKERIFETSVTTGVGEYTLLGAQTGFQPVSVIGASNYAEFFITDDVNWEAIIGTYVAGPARLQRTHIKDSSNGGAAVNWGAGTRKIRCGWPSWLAQPPVLSKSVAGGANVTLTADEQRRLILVFTGALTANINVIVDETPWDWIVFNNTTGAFTLTVKTTAGTGIAVTQGKRATLHCDGVNVARSLDPDDPASPTEISNLKPTFATAASALTITYKNKDGADLSAASPGFIAQRSVTLSDGGFTRRTISANVAMTISSGSTLGHTSAQLCPIYLYLLDNAGAEELAVAGTFQGESGIYSTTAEGGAGGADNPDVMYSTTARASVPGRLAAIAWSNQVTAGTWAATPTEVKPPPFHLERVGAEVAYMGGVVPYGFFLEDGSNVSRTTYAKLFNKIGTTWGVGDGSTTFGLPDSRRRTAVGSGGTGTGTLGNAVGNVGGAETHTLTLAESPAHAHAGSTVPTDETSGPGAAGRLMESDGTGADSTVAVSIPSEGGGGAHNNLQPSMVVTKMIRWLGDI